MQVSYPRLSKACAVGPTRVETEKLGLEYFNVEPASANQRPRSIRQTRIIRGINGRIYVL